MHDAVGQAVCQERGQWVMAYVDSNHGASVNDVEPKPWFCGKFGHTVPEKQDATNMDRM